MQQGAGMKRLANAATGLDLSFIWATALVYLRCHGWLDAVSELIFVLLAAVPVIFSVSKQRYKRFGVARISKYCEGYGEIMELAESKLNNA
jgi:hypothetical protein